MSRPNAGHEAASGSGSKAELCESINQSGPDAPPSRRLEENAPRRSLSIAVVVASVGRPSELAQWRERIRAQTRAPDGFFYVVPSEADLPPVADRVDGSEVVFAPKGLPKQRNRGINAVQERHDVIAFFDDDYLPSATAIDGIARLFEQHPDIIAANGHLIADGINTPGIGQPEGLRLLAEYDAAPRGDFTITEHGGGLYGCNMVYRASAIGDTRFDEALPLYGWQEDVDFGVRIAHRGRIVLTTAFAGVHQGVKAGRGSGVRLGYSQIANPLYLVRKGTMTRRYSLQLVLRNVLSNHVKALRPEPWVDRRGRARGNWLALLDILRGRDHPARILDWA
ncbi:MAG: glycosyltransferase [Rhizorhabdus sp.]